ncbi:hypothetical protein ABVK25_012430 [Lepraria finkii]|uniref:Uncharacterized protein n=1 Tax=Lepraria finkii TaxID=1340010 RepID=A0ABR4AF49_9LECA
MRGPAFDRAVWRALLDIPTGRPSCRAARRPRRPDVFRTGVGRAAQISTASGRNPVSIIVLRVISANGSLTSYGGLHRKRAARLRTGELTRPGRPGGASAAPLHLAIEDRHGGVVDRRGRRFPAGAFAQASDWRAWSRREARPPQIDPDPGLDRDARSAPKACAHLPGRQRARWSKASRPEEPRPPRSRRRRSRRPAASTLPIWGGGHAAGPARLRLLGAVGYALHGAGLSSDGLSEMMSWDAPGKGRWITIYLRQRGPAPSPSSTGSAGTPPGTRMDGAG